MLKNTLKLDAICAKLKKGLSGLPPHEEPCTAATLPSSNGSHSYAEEGKGAYRPDVSPHTKIYQNGDVTERSAQLPTLQATEDNGYSDRELSRFPHGAANHLPEKDGEDSRCSSPKVLSGASKRKSRQRSTRVAARTESPSDWDSGSVNSYQDCDESLDSGVVGSQHDDQMNGLDNWDDMSVDYDEPVASHNDHSQEPNHHSDHNVSMQTHTHTHATSHKTNKGNNLSHTDPTSSKEAEKSTYVVAGHDLRKRSAHKMPNYDETGLSDGEEVRGEATYDPRAIMEYAERSWCNENGTEIEEGLETSDVICEIDESVKPPQGTEGKSRRKRVKQSFTEQVKEVEEEESDPRLRETEQDSRDDDDRSDDVAFVEEEEPMQASSPPPPPVPQHPVKEGQTAPGGPYDNEGLEAVKEYATDTMKEFLGMYGYTEDGSGARDAVEDVPLDHISFKHILQLEKRHAEKKRASVLQRYHAEAPSPGQPSAPKTSSADHPQSLHMKLPESTSTPKEAAMPRNPSNPMAPSHTVLQQLAALHQQLRAEEAGTRDRIEALESEHGAADTLGPRPDALSAHMEAKGGARLATGKTVKQLIEEQEFMRNLMEMGDAASETKRFSKYDYFIQKLEAGESITKDVPNLRVSKYDSYIRKLKAGQSINKIIGRKVSASQRIRDIISQQIQLKQGGAGGGIHGNEHGSAKEEAEALEAAMLENEGYLEPEMAAGSSAATLHLENRSSKYDYFISKLQKGENLSPYALLDGMAPSSGGPSSSAVSPPLGVPSDDHNMDGESQSSLEGSMMMDESYETRNNILKKCLMESGRAELDSEEGSEKGIKSGTLSTASSPGGEGSAFNRYIARFGASQDCGRCSYQFKEHYHCLDEDCKFAPGCHKVYTSTSDVLTHENFHKKNLTLLNDGFQRFRATEDCGTPRCSFYGQKTTHFHCRRPGCEFVFKNKCDIEKHKTFHMKDDIYRKDGFRKFSKHEACKYDGCRYSNTMNHFHCIRSGCSFVFTAANQMHSHKRKHERRQRMMEYETGRHFMRSIRPKLPLPRVNPTYRGLHHQHHRQMSSPGDKPLMMPSPAIIFKSDPGAASIAERAALAGQAAGLGVSQTSPLASQMLPLSAHTASRPDIQAMQPSVITTAPSSSGSLGDKVDIPVRPSILDMHLSKQHFIPTSTATTSSVSSTEYQNSRSDDDDLDDDKPMDLQIQEKLHKVETNRANDDTPTDLSMHESKSGDDSDAELPSGFAKIAKLDSSAEGEDLNDSLNLPIASLISPPGQMLSESVEAPSGGHAVLTKVKEEPREDGKQEEAWQKYFRRYTANDHCYSSCDLLYKGHYHCIVEGCGEYFRSKEGVNKHTRFHIMSDEASELGFQYYQHGQSCEDIFKGCPFSPLAHYHCLWSLKPGMYCGEVVHTGSSLMKPHYEKHRQNPELETIRHSEVDKPAYLGTPVSPAPQQLAPVSHKEQSLKWFPPPPGQTAAADNQGYCEMAPGKCPKPECPLVGQKHFHCTRSECNFATESTDMLHDHKSNERLIFDSFRQFSRKLDCRRPGCKYNLLHKHYHCMHQGCQFSFLQIQQMESHGRKHMRRIYGKFFNRPNNNSPTGPQQLVLPILPLNSTSPPGGALASPPGNTSMVTSSPMQLATSSPIALATSGPLHTAPSSMANMFVSPIPSSMQSVLAISQPPIATANGLLMGGASPKPLHQFLVPISPLDAEEPSPSATNAIQSPPTGLHTLPNFQLGRWKIRSSSVITPPRKCPPPPHKRPLTLVVEDPGAPSGYKRYKRGPLDSSMQERFERFERNVHCGESACQFAMNTTHYHCLHVGCNYKFAGKTMMYKHAQHHDRVDSIIQDDFQRFKASVSCDRGDCEYTAKSTHFHCLRCPFICTDSGKVAIHRKQHAKTEAVSAAGFRQFSSTEKCVVDDCKYSQKYSHFHCIRPGCMQAVIGMTQMDSHSRKHRH